MSSALLVPFDFMCSQHKEQEVQHIDLAPGNAKKRLFCNLCENKPNTTQSIPTLFKFLEDVKSKYSSIKQIVDVFKNDITQLKKDYNSYFDSLIGRIIEWETTIESRKQIRENQLQILLQRHQKYSNQVLEEFINQLSNQINVEPKKISWKSPFYQERDQKFKDSLSNKIKELQDFIEKPDSLYQFEPREPSQDFSIQSEIVFAHPINVMEFNNDGTLLAVGSKVKIEDCYFSLWGIQNNQLSLIQRFSDHTKELSAICFSSQNNSILTGSSDTTAIFWKQKYSKCWVLANKFDFQMRINCLKFNYSADQIAIGVKELTIWYKNQREEWEQSQTIQEHKKPITCVNFNQDDSKLISADKSKQIVVSQYQKNQWVHFLTLSCANESINFLNFFSANDFISVSNDKEIINWIFSEEFQDYECKIQKLDDRIDKTDLTNHKLVILNHKGIHIYDISKFDINYTKIINLNCETFQLSRDGRKIAVYTTNKLQIIH